MRVSQRERKLDHICLNFAILAKIKLIWQYFEGLFSIWHNFDSTLANCVCFWGNFNVVNGRKLK